MPFSIMSCLLIVFASPPGVDSASIVEEQLAGCARSRDWCLLNLGRFLASAGQFDLAADAYEMFLDEFGSGHVNSATVYFALGRVLAPLRTSRTTVVQSADGPHLRVEWARGQSPDAARLGRARQVYRSAADLLHDPEDRAHALLQLGWIDRARDDWAASTTTWLRCADEFPQTRAAPRALWLASENEEWLRRTEKAIDALRRFVATYPNDRQLPGAVARIDELQIQIDRLARWRLEPLAALHNEIAGRPAALSEFAVFLSAHDWLEALGRAAEQRSITHWACEQSHWPAEQRWQACWLHVNALLEGGNDPSAVAEARTLLRRIVAQKADTDLAASAALRLSVVLCEDTEGCTAGLAVLRSAQDGASSMWELRLLRAELNILAKQQRCDDARGRLTTAISRHPEWGLDEGQLPCSGGQDQ